MPFLFEGKKTRLQPKDQLRLSPERGQIAIVREGKPLLWDDNRNSVGIITFGLPPNPRVLCDIVRFTVECAGYKCGEFETAPEGFVTTTIEEAQ